MLHLRACLLSDGEFDRFREDILRQAQAFNEGRLWRKVSSTLVPDDIVNDVLLAFYHQSASDGNRLRRRLGEIVETHLMQVNGDMQRGKTAVEALTSIAVFLINKHHTI